MDFVGGAEHCLARCAGGDRGTTFRQTRERSDDESNRSGRSLGLLPSQRDQGRGARRQDVTGWSSARTGSHQGRTISGRTKRDRKGGADQRNRSEVEFSSTRNLRWWRNNVP